MFEENGILYADSSKELLKIQDATSHFFFWGKKSL